MIGSKITKEGASVFNKNGRLVGLCHFLWVGYQGDLTSYMCHRWLNMVMFFMDV